MTGPQAPQRAWLRKHLVLDGSQGPELLFTAVRILGTVVLCC